MNPDNVLFAVERSLMKKFLSSPTAFVRPSIGEASSMTALEPRL